MSRRAWPLALLPVVLAANINYANVKYSLDPASQNSPLHISQRHLRPPPPRIPPQFDIFLGISAYRDGVRCGVTLFTAFSRATHPDRVHVGVVDQVLPTDAKCLAEYCKLATAEWGECKFQDQIKIDTHNALQSTGPTGARHAQQLLIGDEEFCLQLDAHSQLINGWDTLLVKDWARTNNEMAVLSTYPPGFDMIGPNLTYPHLSASHLCDHGKRNDEDGVPYANGYWYIEYSELPQLSAFFGAGLSFSKCHAERRAPVDNQTPWLFFGEESLRAFALWSNGYDFYSPSRHGSVVFHNWTDDRTRTSFSQAAPQAVADKKAKEEQATYNRVRAVLTLPFHGDVDTTNLHVFYNGTVRSVDAFLTFHGVSNANVSLDQERCHQLHWVPYGRPDAVEELLPGWYMHQPAHEHADDEANEAAVEAKLAAQDARQAIERLQDQVKLSVDQLDAVKGLLEAIAQSLTRNDTDRLDEVVQALKGEVAAREQAWFDRVHEKDHVLQAMEVHLKQLSDRSTLDAFSETMPALVVVAALAMVALATRWRRTATSCGSALNGPPK